MRRPVSVCLYFLLALLCLGSTPLLLPLLALYDLGARRRWASVRVLLFFDAYLVAELAGITIASLVWLLGFLPPLWNRDRYLAAHFTLQRFWVAFLFSASRLLWGFRMEVENAELAREGPYLLFARHASLADTLLPLVTIGHPAPHLRFITKSQLLWDPCIDIVGNRIPNAFVARGGRDPEGDIRRVRAMAEGLTEAEAVLIFPEGTRFSPEKKARLLERLEEKGEEETAAYARGLTHTLPPRTGGTLALIDAAPGVDVLFMAHVGTEGSATATELWQGRFIGQEVRVDFWRVPASEIPTSPGEREDWLRQQWQRMDAWVGEHSR
ncbi:MAG: 1-acyl-sn-glycerol-3-phosphate acyltransferase [Myxococcota bacterium]|nr:1-acyl-sn-glycerol-3-phosphate acyltransferase [Myxococcota bacterium]